jgi:signal transduction histidine kinase/DNA-binding response OmpR family regulator/HPt (histidine-containing phosphotransfer) domain-containing protein
MDPKTVIRENSIQLVVVLAIFLFMIIFGCTWATSNVEQYMRSSAEEMLVIAEERLQATLRESETALVSIGVTMVQKQINQKEGLNIDEVQSYLSSLNDTFIFTETHAMGYQNVFWYKPGGGIFISGFAWNPPSDFMVEDLPWYAAAKSQPGKIVVSAPYQSPRSHNPIITVAVMLVGEGNQNYGFLGIDINLRDIARSMAGFQVEDGGYGYLIGPVSEEDKRLCFLSYPDPSYENIPLETLGSQYVELDRRLNLGAASISSMRLTTIQGTDVVAFYRKTYNGWYAGLAFPRKEYFYNVYIMSIIYTTISLCLMVTLCYFLLRLSMDKMHSDEENRAKSSFLAQVSHEIRTPLNSIMGMSEIILRKDISSELYEDVSIIKQAGNILLSIINNILDFSKMETNQIQIEANPYNPASMIYDVINIARLRLMDKPVDLFVDVDSNIPAELIGDEVKVRQLLINLLNNAIKYTKTGHIKFTITGRTFSRNESVADQIRLVFSIEDTGVGIKPEDMKHLFKEFTRLDLEHNHDIEGTGLGLTIANSFCRAMGGNIAAASTYGKGSVFTATVIQTFRNSGSIAQLEEPGKRVLIFEDRPAYRESLLSAFSSLGLQPQCAWDLPSFIRDIRGDQFDYAFVPSRYAVEATASWEASGSPVKLTVMLNSDDMSSSHRVGSVHLPIYSCVLANVLNGAREMEKHMFRPDRIGFTAPTARILVVDDLPTNLRVAEELMKPYGMKIDTCLSGSEALDLTRLNRYDMVFMDHMMPEMDGLTATDLIRKQGVENGSNAYYRNLPIIMLTANAVAGQREMFLKNGVDDFLSKPIDVGKLNKILETWIPQEKKEKNMAPSGTKESPGDLPAIPGIDIREGLKNSGGSLHSYTGILSYYCRDVDERIPLIRQAAADADFSSYTTMVHAVKGASRSIGAGAVGDLAAELEAAGRGQNTGVITEKTDALLQNLRELTGHIRAALGEQEEEDSYLEVSDLGLEVLREALSTMDTGAVNSLLSGMNDRKLNRATKKYVADLENHILLFEYDEAVNKIAAAQKLPPPPPPRQIGDTSPIEFSGEHDD